MGNEFGHPEWIDFPREGNGNSYDYCRRQWNLMYDTNLRYPQLLEFDKVMNATEIQYKSMISEHQFVTQAHEVDKMIIYEKGKLLFIYNFHQDKSYENYHVGTLWESDHFILFESDEDRFGGHQRLNDAHGRWFESHREECCNRPNKIILYIPSRTCIVLCPYENTLDVEGEIKGMPQVTDRQRNQVKGKGQAPVVPSQPVVTPVEKPTEVKAANDKIQLEVQIEAKKKENIKSTAQEKKAVEKKF